MSVITKKVSFLSIVLTFLCVIAVGCSSTTPESKPMPSLTFEHVKPLSLNVANVEIVNEYSTQEKQNDFSSSFPTPPDIALRRYADNKLKAAGDADTLKFVIEGANVKRSLVLPAGKFTSWMGINKKDLYEVDLRIRMFTYNDQGSQSDHSILNLRRSIAIPQRYSVADKEHEKFMFLEMLMKDVDDAVTKALDEKMDLTAANLYVPSTALLATPEIR